MSSVTGDLDVADILPTVEGAPFWSVADVPTTEEMTSFWEVTAAKYLYAVPSIILIILGTVGNSLSFVVFNSPRTRHTVTSVYFRVLGITDTVALYSGGIVVFVVGAFDLDIRNLSSVSCKFWKPMLTVFCYFSCWVLVFISVDRFIGVWMPHKYRKLCSKKLAVINVLVLLVVISATVGVFWVLALDVHPDSGECNITARYLPLYDSVLVYLDLVMLNLVPNVVLVTLNVLIIIQLSRAAEIRRSATAGGRNKGDKSGSSATAILLSVSLVYILCTLPSCTAFLVTKAFGESPHGQAQVLLYVRCCDTLYMANHAVNFALYCIHGTEFRRELGRICGRSGRSQGGEATHTTSMVSMSTTRGEKYIHRVNTEDVM